jgi:hypothetical protein
VCVCTGVRVCVCCACVCLGGGEACVRGGLGENWVRNGDLDFEPYVVHTWFHV